ncbi:MAG: FitA-like ribbon-helix-helix domain-containing protein [Spirochaetaceae bacterium]
MQYTIRGIPSTVDAKLRERARRNRRSLNETVVETLRRGLELEAAEATFDDLDDLIGTWQEDAAFDTAIAEQDTLDMTAWE